MRALRPESRAGVLMWLALAVCAGYANVLGTPFQFDDYNVIVNEEQVHSWANWFAALDSGIRPLLKFSYTLNWTLGTGVAGFHVTNLLIHLANAYLVYCLAQAFTQQQWLRDSLRPVPLFTALLFAVHPVHTEAVSYICGRSASLMALFYLAALLSYVIGRSRDNRFYIYVATPLLFVLALAVKETAMTFPLALLLWELGCGGRWNTAFKPQWPVWAVSGIAVLFFIFSNSYFAQMQRSAEFNSLTGNLATHLYGFAWLLRQWALPLWLNIDPDLPLLTNFTGALWPLMLFLALFALMLACWRRRPWLGFALAWAMLQLIPLYLFLPRLDIANERQMYLAGWPLLLALSIELALWLNDRAFRLIAAAVLLTLVSLTVLRNQVYASEISLWQDTVQKSPHKARAHNNLGHAYLLAQRPQDARSEFSTALQLDPRLFQARHNLYRADDEMEMAGGALRP
ncbi:MAG: tetratricopeptide repeat protein [Nitrosomonadales bacterium]|nr:tetratricopeptide repeat protein [Nitrosomonadales bacterium]